MSQAAEYSASKAHKWKHDCSRRQSIQCCTPQGKVNYHVMGTVKNCLVGFH